MVNQRTSFKVFYVVHFEIIFLSFFHSFVMLNYPLTLLIFFGGYGVQDDGDMPESVFSIGVQLTEQQWDRRNAIMLAFGAGVGASFVHCLMIVGINKHWQSWVLPQAKAEL